MRTGVVSFALYGVSLLISMLLRTWYGDDCFVPQHTAREIGLSRVQFAVLACGLVCGFVGLFKDKSKALSGIAVVGAFPLLILQGLIAGCD